MNESPGLRRGDSFCQVYFLLVGVYFVLFVTLLPSWSDGLYFLFGIFLP